MFRCLAMIAVLLFSSAASADVVFPPGSRIGLEMPVEMEVSSRFLGFENPDKMASITVMELPAATFEQAVATLARAELKRQGFFEKTRQSFKVDGRDAVLVGGEQVVEGQKIRKWIAVFGDATTTGFLIAQAPRGKESYSDAEMIAALKSVTLREPLSTAQQAESLPFTIGDLACFRIVRVVGGSTIFLTEGPKDNDREGEQPVIVITAALGASSDEKGREALANQLLASNQNLRNIIPERSQSFRLKGDEWHEIVARANDTLSARPVIVVQTLRFRGNGYIRMQAMIKAEGRVGMLSRFLTLFDSVDFRGS